MNGNLLITVPLVWNEHEQPNDYARYSSFRLKFILEKHGFQIIQHLKSMNDVRAIFQLVNAYTYKKVVSKNRWLNLYLFFLLMLPVNIIGSFFALIFPANNDLYLDNIILAKKIRHAI